MAVLTFNLRRVSAPSFKSALEGDNNFDALRQIAALGVILSHAYPVTQGHQNEELLHVLTKNQTTLGEVCVIVFFVISGFLIAKSFSRSTSVIEYLVSRSLRIIPGLSVMAIVVAFLLGPLLTSLSITEYFSAAGSYRFLATSFIYNAPQWLPGVFKENTYPEIVNASLWTLSYEFSCYTALASLGLVWRKAWIPALLLSAFTLASIFLTWISPGLFLSFAGYFLGGSLAYIFRSRIPLDVRWLVLSIGVVATTLVVGQGFKLAMYFFGAYAILWISLTPSNKFNVFSRYGDLSFGTYIYAFPIQQTIAPWINSPLLNFLVAAPIVLVCAAASWHFVEKPALSKKRAISEWVGRHMRTLFPAAHRARS